MNPARAGEAIVTIVYIGNLSEPQNIEQVISNVEVTPFVILRFLVRYSIFNVSGRLQELNKTYSVSCVDKSQVLTSLALTGVRFIFFPSIFNRTLLFPFPTVVTFIIFFVNSK